jgi:hypothetical protein
VNHPTEAGKGNRPQHRCRGRPDHGNTNAAEIQQGGAPTEGGTLGGPLGGLFKILETDSVVLLRVYQTRPTDAALWKSKLLDRKLGNLRWIAITGLADLNDLFRNDLGQRVVAVNQMQGAQRPFIGVVQEPNLFRP